MTSMWTPVSSLPGMGPLPGMSGGQNAPPSTGGVTPLPAPPGTGGVTPLPWQPPPPSTGGVTPLPFTSPGPSVDGWDPRALEAKQPQTGGVTPLPATPGDGAWLGGSKDFDESSPLPNTGGVFPKPGVGPTDPPETGGGDPRPPTGPGSIPYNGVNPRQRQPEWGQRAQPSFRRPGFWQAVKQMAQPSIGVSAASQARAQQQQSNAARARAAFLSGFNNVRRPMNQYRDREQVAYAGGSRNFDESAQWPQTGGGRFNPGNQSLPNDGYENQFRGSGGGAAPYSGGVGDPRTGVEYTGQMPWAY